MASSDVCSVRDRGLTCDEECDQPEDIMDKMRAYIVRRDLERCIRGKIEVMCVCDEISGGQCRCTPETLSFWDRSPIKVNRQTATFIRLIGRTITNL
jgi:hypothetical protein